MALPVSEPLSLSPCPDSGTQPGGVPSAPTGPLGPPGHGQTLGKSEGIRAGRALGREGVGPSGCVEGGPGSRLHQTHPPGCTLIQLPSLPPEFMHAVAHQIIHEAMVAAVASAATGNNLKGEAWEGGPGPWWWAPSAGLLRLGPQPSSVSPLPPTGQQVPSFPTAPTRLVIARPTPPQARPSHPGGPPVSGALVSRGGGVPSGKSVGRNSCGRVWRGHV